MTASTASPLSFEQSLQQLQSIVERLERSDLDLSTAIAMFEQGVQLSRQCGSLLQEAEQKVELLTRTASNTPQIVPFETQQSSDEE